MKLLIHLILFSLIIATTITLHTSSAHALASDEAYLPDLQIIGLEPSLAPNGVYEFIVAVGNTGTAATDGDTPLEIKLTVDKVNAGMFTINEPLLINTSVSQTITTSKLPRGQYKITAKVGYGDYVPESDTNNNHHSGILTVHGPDSDPQYGWSG